MRQGQMGRKEGTITYSKAHRENEESITLSPYERGTGYRAHRDKTIQMEMNEDKVKGQRHSGEEQSKSENEQVTLSAVLIKKRQGGGRLGKCV